MSRLRAGYVQTGAKKKSVERVVLEKSERSIRPEQYLSEDVASPAEAPTASSENI
jgi:hypothetical protein